MLSRVVVVAALAMGTVQTAAVAAEAPAAPATPATAPTSKPAKKPPVDFRKLKELMPAELAGVKRSDNQGEKVSLGEMQITTARAQYSKTEPAENDPQVTIEIADYAATPEMGNVMTAWQTMEVDRESDTGFERTTKIKEQPAFETYQNEGKSGQVQMWIGGRFYVNVQTTNLTAEQVKKLAESLPIDKLVELSKS